MDSLPNVTFVRGDFLQQNTIDKIQIELNNQKANVILSDMAHSTCGIKKIDHLKIMNIAESVVGFSQTFLKPNGSLVIKIFHGESEQKFIKDLKKMFSEVHWFKPMSSRKESTEIYIVCKQYILR
jgi:23S rRNA (uridine2552-2'-O)-methyltransferase